mmetsp:Transcript_14829/g.35913  ORF Transcript_14829/g.35913 Transcript_14829/m.35913 type:complete len:365 (+) Transcript_14829:1826-2920(+)
MVILVVLIVLGMIVLAIVVIVHSIMVITLARLWHVVTIKVCIIVIPMVVSVVHLSHVISIRIVLWIVVNILQFIVTIMILSRWLFLLFAAGEFFHWWRIPILCRLFLFFVHFLKSSMTGIHMMIMITLLRNLLQPPMFHVHLFGNVVWKVLGINVVCWFVFLRISIFRRVFLRIFRNLFWNDFPIVLDLSTSSLVQGVDLVQILTNDTGRNTSQNIFMMTWCPINVIKSRMVGIMWLVALVGLILGIRLLTIFGIWLFFILTDIHFNSQCFIDQTFHPLASDIDTRHLSSMKPTLSFLVLQSNAVNSTIVIRQDSIGNSILIDITNDRSSQEGTRFKQEWKFHMFHQTFFNIRIHRKGSLGRGH